MNITDVSQQEAELSALRLRLLRQAKFAVGDAGLAEDLVQDVLMAVVQGRSGWQQRASLSTWATSILKNKVADWFRSPQARRMVPLEAAAGDTDEDQLEDAVATLYDAQGAYREPVPAWQQPETRLEQQEMMTTLGRCVDSLPRQTGRVFMMREWLGFETGEICSRTGISAENCRTILHRARTSLRNCMQREWLGGAGQP